MEYCGQLLQNAAATASLLTLSLASDSRPTAVNLAIAEQQLNALAAQAAAAAGATAASVTEAIVGACDAMLQADVAGNKVRCTASCPCFSLKSLATAQPQGMSSFKG